MLDSRSGHGSGEAQARRQCRIEYGQQFIPDYSHWCHCTLSLDTSLCLLRKPQSIGPGDPAINTTKCSFGRSTVQLREVFNQ